MSSIEPLQINGFCVRLVKTSSGEILAYVVDVIRGIFKLVNITQARTYWNEMEDSIVGTFRFDVKSKTG